jgi:hypothetical protein
MENKCAICSILFDVACPNPLCAGHHNASVGDICAYCASNEREEVLFLCNLHPSLLSSLEDFELDLDNNI